MAISFGSEITGDLARGQEREWLITNGLGSYGSGTVAGTRTRAYHGLLMAALRAPADPCERTLLVAALQEALEVGGRSIPLEHPWIVSFALEGTVPTWRYALGDALLEKRLWMQPGAHTTTVFYRLLQASQPLRLSLTALVNSRSHHGGIPRPEISLQAVSHGVRLVPQGTVAPPFVVLSDRGATTLASPGEWCGGFALPAEEERGLPSRDDHLRACRITALLSAEAPTLTVVASTEREPPLDGERALQGRRVHDAALLARWQQAHPGLAKEAPPWVEQLVLAADQFVVARTTPPEGRPEEGQGREGRSILAGYPWFGDWGRDTMISLPGLTLVTGRAAIAAQILRTYGRFISQGMVPNCFPEGRETLGEGDYNTVDATLWYVEALRLYHQATGDGALIRELFPRLQEIVEAHCQGTRHGIRRDPADGLLRAGEEGLQLTWMDAKVNGEVITPRIGKPVEVNALWCCALRTMVPFAELCGKPSEGYRDLAAAAERGFQRFWNAAAGWCFDVLDQPDGSHDGALRPNQLLAVALTDGLLSAEQARQVVGVCGQHLLTPVGLRSLDPRHPGYQGHYGGSPLERDRAYHQGTVWGWWLGPYALAHGRVHGDPQGALHLLEAVGHHLVTAGVGSISEIFDGEAPHWPRGCIAQAWSVAEVLRAWVALRGMGQAVAEAAP
ncbi:MAG: amylo-alpha-1,6-glucosidase [Cyanobacteriota bacterium]|nr:amylo-alpha-1,6-glucosidase [Cyanobacteriota bacterium]